LRKKKATVGFVVSVCPSSVGIEQFGSHSTDFHEILYFGILFFLNLQKIEVSLKRDKTIGVFI